MSHLLLQGLAFIKEMTDLLGDGANLLTEFVFVNTRQLIQQPLVFLQLSLRLGNLSLQSCNLGGAVCP
jgi:hypothetical protein